ncbi:hypothetical protein MKW98_006460, partial [Papaver atlanticum]
TIRSVKKGLYLEYNLLVLYILNTYEMLFFIGDLHAASVVDLMMQLSYLSRLWC